MDQKPTPGYLSIKQLCEKWGFLPSQMEHTLKTHKARLWLYINDKKSLIDNQYTQVYEVKINTLKDADFFRLGKLSNKELENEGFTITEMPESGSILARKNAEEILITRKDDNLHISLPHFKSSAKIVTHDGFVELCEDSFINPQIGLSHLFRKEQTGHNLQYIFKVKCEKKGYIRFLNPACSAKISDIYLHHEEANRIKLILDEKNKEKNTTPTKYRNDAISKAMMTHIFPEIMVGKYKFHGDINRWECFLMLKNALEKIGSTNVKIYIQKNKEESTVCGTDSDGDTIDTSYKAFNKRFPNLLKVYNKRV